MSHVFGYMYLYTTKVRFEFQEQIALLFTGVATSAITTKPEKHNRHQLQTTFPSGDSGETETACCSANQTDRPTGRYMAMERCIIWSEPRNWMNTVFVRRRRRLPAGVLVNEVEFASRRDFFSFSISPS